MEKFQGKAPTHLQFSHRPNKKVKEKDIGKMHVLQLYRFSSHGSSTNTTFKRKLFQTNKP